MINEYTGNISTWVEHAKTWPISRLGLNCSFDVLFSSMDQYFAPSRILGVD